MFRTASAVSFLGVSGANLGFARLRDREASEVASGEKRKAPFEKSVWVKQKWYHMVPETWLIFGLLEKNKKKGQNNGRRGSEMSWAHPFCENQYESVYGLSCPSSDWPSLDEMKHSNTIPFCTGSWRFPAQEWRKQKWQPESNIMFFIVFRFFKAFQKNELVGTCWNMLEHVGTSFFFINHFCAWWATPREQPAIHSWTVLDGCRAPDLTCAAVQWLFGLKLKGTIG